MSAFAEIPLAELCTIVGGGTPRRSNAAYFDGTIPWATPTDVTALDQLFIERTKEAITEIGLNKSSARLIPAGTVLMTSRATIGYTAIATRPMATNQGFANLICGDRIVPEYLAYWLRDQRERLIQLAGGTTFKELPKSTLKKVCLPVPPLDEQQRIVGILNRAAKIERLRKQAKERLREFIPALFVKMFGDPIENPMGWEQVSLGDLSEVQGGLQITPKRSRHPIETPYLRVANVFRDQLELTEMKSMRVTEKELERVRLIRGDLLIVEGHGNASEIGRTAIWDGSISDCIHQNHLIRLRPGSMILPEFACAFLNSSSGRSHLLRSGKTTSGLNTISTSNVKSCSVCVPPIDLQRQYSYLVEATRTVVHLAQVGSSVALALNATLMSRLLEVGAASRDGRAPYWVRDEMATEFAGLTQGRR